MDNRILTVFKEGKPGRREEIENVEVKLFEAGMYVYGLHTSGHDYVTDELWAAFYKKLLEERLVPSIVLSHESPGFDWIKKFAEPGEWRPQIFERNSIIFKAASTAFHCDFFFREHLSIYVGTTSWYRSSRGRLF